MRTCPNLHGYSSHIQNSIQSKARKSKSKAQVNQVQRILSSLFTRDILYIRVTVGTYANSKTSCTTSVPKNLSGLQYKNLQKYNFVKKKKIECLWKIKRTHWYLVTSGKKYDYCREKFTTSQFSFCRQDNFFIAEGVLLRKTNGTSRRNDKYTWGVLNSMKQ